MHKPAHTSSKYLVKKSEIFKEHDHIKKRAYMCFARTYLYMRQEKTNCTRSRSNEKKIIDMWTEGRIAASNTYHSSLR